MEFIALMMGSNLTMTILFLVNLQHLLTYFWVKETRMCILILSHCLLPKRVTFQKNAHCLWVSASIRTQAENGDLCTETSPRTAGKLNEETLQNGPFSKIYCLHANFLFILLFIAKAFKRWRIFSPVFGRLDSKHC